MPSSGINHTREVVMQRLGGPYDYTGFAEDLRTMMLEKESIDRQYRSEAL